MSVTGFNRPRRLCPGDTVAVVSPSWGGPHCYPHVYAAGLSMLREWGLIVQEFPTARADADTLRANPKARAQDINDAFADPAIKAIFASIGGDDSVRILPHLDSQIIAANPKILMGYSDTTTLHVFANLLGLVTFYGPSIMAGFAQMRSLPERFDRHVHTMLFEPAQSYAYAPYHAYCDGYPDWSDVGNADKVKPLSEDGGWQWLQGSGIVQGHLFGGCLDVLEMMKATPFWPPPQFWQGKVFFLETSEMKPPVHFVGDVLRNYGMQGVFDRISALIFGRARNYTDLEKRLLEQKIIDVVVKEFDCSDLPIIANFDVGHTDPQLVLPSGVNATIDCDTKRVALTEPCVR